MNSYESTCHYFYVCQNIIKLMQANQLLQLCTASIVFSTLVTVRLYAVMQGVCRWLTNEKQRKNDIRLIDQ